MFFSETLLGSKPNHKMDLAALLNGRTNKKNIGAKKPAGKKTKKQTLKKKPAGKPPRGPSASSLSVPALAAHDGGDDLYVRLLLGWCWHGICRLMTMMMMMMMTMIEIMMTTVMMMMMMMEECASSAWPIQFTQYTGSLIPPPNR